jgi:signal transduction histidine kinase
VDELLWEAQQVVDSKYPDNQVQYDFSNLPATFEHLQVDGNESLLKVAITNIIDNACKFSNNKKVIVRLTGTEKAVQILVEDSGIGIPEEDINHIFEPLYRASNARDQKGFGVGLSLAQKILHVHKGLLEITSGPGKGTTVRILIPTGIARTGGESEFTP